MSSQKKLFNDFAADVSSMYVTGCFRTIFGVVTLVFVTKPPRPEYDALSVPLSQRP